MCACMCGCARMVKGAERKRGQLGSKGDSFLKNEREEKFIKILTNF